MIYWVQTTKGGHALKKVMIQVEGFQCERCDYQWAPRGDQPPRVCPKCKSPYWDRPRKGEAEKAS